MSKHLLLALLLATLACGPTADPPALPPGRPLDASASPDLATDASDAATGQPEAATVPLPVERPGEWSTAEQAGQRLHSWAPCLPGEAPRSVRCEQDPGLVLESTELRTSVDPSGGGCTWINGLRPLDASGRTAPVRGRALALCAPR